MEAKRTTLNIHLIRKVDGTKEIKTQEVAQLPHVTDEDLKRKYFRATKKVMALVGFDVEKVEIV